MDNPQHYQPLSHALNQDLASSHIHYTNTHSNYPSASRSTSRNIHDQHDDVDEEDDVGIVEQQLHENDMEIHHPGTNEGQQGVGQSIVGSTGEHGLGNGSSLSTTDSTHTNGEGNSVQKRRPGRPRGSKNSKKVKAESGTALTTSAPASVSSSPQFQPPGGASTGVNSQNQQYYEFQWRVLNLCAEFYTAAEELVKATPPLVIAQSYQMGPSAKIDPLTMLGEAKRLCDSLLANPSQLTANPPPPMYPQTHFNYAFPPVAMAAPSNTASNPPPTAIITNPQSFSVPLNPTPNPNTQYYQPQAQPYATLPYYYPQPYAGGYASPAPQAIPMAHSPSHSVNLPPTAANGGSQGAWSDEETERLKQMAEQSKSTNPNAVMDWDWVVNQWGPSRTRHQILIKATAAGLKVSTSRNHKRRREATDDVEDTHVSSGSGPPTTAMNSVSSVAAASISPPHSQTASNHTSPSMQHSQTPVQANARLGWHSPVMVVDTPSPIITPQPGDSQRPNYYRPRASDPSMKPDSLSSHHYVYQPNGSSGGSKFSKQNGR